MLLWLKVLHDAHLEPDRSVPDGRSTPFSVYLHVLRGGSLTTIDQRSTPAFKTRKTSQLE